VRHHPSVLRIVAGVVVLVVVAAGLWLFLGRPTVEATSTVDPDVTIRCDGSTSVSEAACRDWGDEILAAGPPSHTFEMKDLSRLDLSRALLGFSDTCEASFFLERYESDSAWNEEVPCPGD
jgi:hypothetical protein